MIDYNTPVFYNDGYDDYGGDTRRTEYHLTQALNNISNIFEVSSQFVSLYYLKKLSKFCFVNQIQL